MSFMMQIATCSCHQEKKNEGFHEGKNLYKIKKLGKLPEKIQETSGLALATKEGTFWTHNDSGNPAHLYEIAQSGKIIRQLNLPQLTNTDWEDLGQDIKGNLYIADVGNNANQRKDLVVYKIHPNQATDKETIHFHYADQTAFPPPPNEQNFDCEAIVWHKEKLYLFSKNRSKTNRFVKLYTIPDVAGSYVATPQDSVYSKAMVTGADISPNGKTLALLTYGKILLFDVSEGINFKKPTYCIKANLGQSEAIVFVNDTDFVVTNEQKGELWSIKRK
ncbi:MAG: hypothetical protein R2822_16865 [Spirosomataceae bacterium]